MTSLNTQTRKFLFFDEVKETPEKNITKKNKKEEKKIQRILSISSQDSKK